MKLSRVKPSRLTLCLILLFAALTLGRDVTATRTNVSPKIDGNLADIAWAAAKPTTGFTYRGMDIAWPASEQTVIEILYDDDALYLGIACYESNPAEIVAEMVRDDDPLWLDDAITIFLDTFSDGRSGYMLVVNPQGTRYDAVFSQDGQYIDDAWDGDWTAAAGIESDRWVVEIAIPWRELHYADPAQGWGIDFWRNENPWDESTIWSNQNANLYKASEFGRLVGLDDLTTPVTLSVSPYGTARRQWNDLERYLYGSGGQATIGNDITDYYKLGLDVDFRPFPAMSLAGTINPDYAHIESDLDEINLSRDELYLNEKRPFFRDGKSLFDLPMELFYSRRIKEIDYAGKIYGKVGGLRYYVMDVEGAVYDKADWTHYRGDFYADPIQSNVAALRLTQDVFTASAIGLTVVNNYQRERHVWDIDPYWNLPINLHRDEQPLNETVLGLDFSLATDFNLQAIGQVAYQLNEDKDISAPAWYAEAEWYDQSWTLGFSAQQVTPDFDPSTSYLPYSSLDTIGGEVYAEYTWSIWEGWFEYLYLGGNYYYYGENDSDLMAYRGWGSYLGVNLAADLTLYGSYWSGYESEEMYSDRRLTFQNDFYSGTLGYAMNRWSSASLTYIGGDYYGYGLHYWELDLSLAPFSGLTLDGSVEYERLMGEDVVYRMEGDHWFVSGGLTARFLDELWLRLFAQRNTLAGREEASALLAYNYLPGSYVYLAYNLLQPTDREETEHQLFLKLTFTLDI